MFDFNTTETNTGVVSIFNNGNAGRVKNVKLSLEIKPKGEFSNSPDVKFWFEDQSGNKCNTGWYHFTKDESKDDATNMTRFKNNILTLLAIAKAMVPADFVFADSTGFNEKQAEDYLISVINDHKNATLVNVFVCYGYTGKPSQYIGTRKFNFIEKATVTDEATSLKAGPKDVMERIEATPQQAPTNGGSAGTPNAGGFWSGM